MSLGIKPERWPWRAQDAVLSRLARTAAGILPCWESAGGALWDYAQGRRLSWTANTANLLSWEMLDVGPGFVRGFGGSGSAYIDGVFGAAEGSNQYTIMVVTYPDLLGGNRGVLDASAPTLVTRLNYAAEHWVDVRIYDVNNNQRALNTGSPLIPYISRALLWRTGPGRAVSMWMDGDIVDTHNLLADPRPLNAAYRLGGSQAGAAPAAASWSLVAFWGYALTDADCAAVSRQPFDLIAPTHQPPVATFAPVGPAPTFSPAWASGSTVTIAPGGPA